MSYEQQVDEAITQRADDIARQQKWEELQQLKEDDKDE